jgi:RNA ligase (TIGR02306 family)
MPIVHEDGRALATVETIANVAPIADADAIEQATVRGWTVVIKKGEYAPGDRVLFIEPDAALPVAEPSYAFLAARGVKTVDDVDYHILKTARLRGVYSQGLVVPLPDGHRDAPTGTDLTAALNLGKFEPPMGVSGGEQVGPFLSRYARKTDADRLQNLVAVWAALKAYGWEATEKVDGTSATILRDVDGRLRVCGRNFEIGDGDNVYWNLVRRYPELFDLLGPGETLQLEIVGPGIQANRLGLPDVRPFIFSHTHDHEPVRRAAWAPPWQEFAAPLLPLELPDSVEAAIAQADGLLTATGTKPRQAEGIVWHTVDGRTLPELDGRECFKVINRKYLVKHGL